MDVALYDRDHGPIIQLVDLILKKAITQSASDIHFEPTKDALRVRYRIDGMLYDQRTVDASQMSPVLARLKVMANIDITEKRIPQDGKISLTTLDERLVDLRISTFPGLYGEKVVIRVLDRDQSAVSINSLGFSDATCTQFRELLNRASGFILASGPTGSGKTTTLYAALSELNKPQKNIITLEDPVEYDIAGITQGHINPDVGFTFEKGIRALLRQDPDIIMVGEIRDKQTARIAIEAALTGHLVFSTVHTNDAPSVIMRLMDMGIEPFLINAAVTGMLAQRLVRKICSNCCVDYKPTKEERAVLSRLAISLNTVYKGTGCEQCMHLGYRGRIGIFELLTMNNALRACIIENPRFETIYQHARTQGMQTLVEDATQKLRNGVITLEEFVRVIG